MHTEWDVIVIGAGAAGLFCAMHAAGRGRSTLVLERGAAAGRKIALSGGGRCNFTNLNAAPEHYVCANPHFVKAALARFTPQGFLDLVRRHRIDYCEKGAGQLFCSGSAGGIVRMLRAECADKGVRILTHCTIQAIRRQERFLVETPAGTFAGRALVVATGGLSYPQSGATGLGYRIAEQFGLHVQPTRPALVPLVWARTEVAGLRALSGIALPAAVRCGKRSFRDQMLFTHRGLSGPVVLQISSYWTPGEEIRIDLLPEADFESVVAGERGSAKELKTVLSRYWPERFARFWTEHHAASKPMRQYSNRELRAIAAQMHAWAIRPAGTEGYRTAEVTGGGVDTRELSSQTMEARRVSGLYFVGEVVDVTGHLGGFNLQWAWSSGFAAGQAV